MSVVGAVVAVKKSFIGTLLDGPVLVRHRISANSSYVNYAVRPLFIGMSLQTNHAAPDAASMNQFQ